MSKNNCSKITDSGFFSSSGSVAFDERSKSLPSVELDEPQVTDLKEKAAIDQMNQYLEGIDNEQGRKFLYSRDEDGDTKLHLALIHGFEVLALRIIMYASSPSDLNQTNNDSISPLHLAVYQNFPKVIRKLILNGADLHLQDRSGNTALHLSCKKGYECCIEELIRPKSNFERKMSTIPSENCVSLKQIAKIRNFEGLTCLHEAVINGSLSSLTKLLAKQEFRETINDRDYKYGRTILHFAVDSLSRDFNSEILTNVLAHIDMEDINAVTYSGYTPIAIAEGLKNDSAVRILQNYRDEGFESMNDEFRSIKF